MRNIFIVASPLQLAGALEAKNKFNGVNSIFVVFIGKNELQNSFMLKIIKRFIDDEIIYIHYTSDLWFLNRKMKLMKKMRNERFLNLFIGDYREFSMRSFACNLAYDKLFLLDDGNSTLVLNSQLVDHITSMRGSYGKMTVRDIFKQLLAYANGLSVKRNVNINWFTMFEFKPLNNGEILKHQFEYLKSSAINVAWESNYSTKIYFIGGEMVKSGVMRSIEIYIDLIRKVRTYYAPFEFIYLPHRYEEKETLEVLANICDLKILRLDNIVELGFIESNIVPSHICSFYSTALYSLKLLYPHCSIEIVTLQKDLLNEEYIEAVENVQSYYKQIFKTILLN
ncbi:hypothetical protein GO495_15915 [Chitinophaga oryziterrae]|uniref:Uncharacterized protein n=1 Tax=Chitinophaga oryziterrae TaxID=1031224 RepID=A0A6N8JCA1_9BACT|nr:hypothetical protein [Chitinophaga oryziterrae]MVT42078.1 hypothetical protein [Chitinophaga oryziterrae]